MGIRRRIHNIRRLREIVRVLVRYEFGHLIERLHLERNLVGRKVLKMKAIRRMEMPEMPESVKLRKALEELGPTFIKFGQLLSMRPEIVSPDIAKELEKLQDKVPPFPSPVARALIERELGHPIEVLFSEFDREPEASASLAQVYRARLTTGEDAVVKVQRPGLSQMIESDVAILHELARLAERHIEESRWYNPVGLVEEFRRVIAREIDFVTEANNIDRFRALFRDDDSVALPRVYPALSGRRVLTLENVQGLKVTDREHFAAAGLDRTLVAKNYADLMLKQIFFKGCFHADPHPGNVRVLPNNRIAFLDFGMVGRLTERMRDALFNVLNSTVRRDVPGIREAFLSIGKAGEGIDIESLDLDLEDLVDLYYGKPLKELNVGQVLLNMTGIVSRHRIRLSADLFLFNRVLITMDGIVRRLDPEFDLVEQSRPFIEEVQRARRSPQRIARDLQRFAQSFARFGRSLPQDLMVIIGKLKKGTLHVEFEHKGLEELTAQLDRASSRVAFSLIIAALLVGSSIIMHVDRGPKYFGFPLLGIAGFIAAAVLGIWLAIIILTESRL